MLTSPELAFNYSIGMCLVIVSLAALSRICPSHVACLLSGFLILILFCFTVFTLVVTNKGAGHAISGKGFKEYRLGDYSKWLQKRVQKTSHWNTIKSDLQDAKVCKKLANNSVNEVAEQFYKRNLSPVESGCCKPPTSCNFLYVNATYWISTADNSTDIDCSRWSNDEDQLCYTCNSCKAGELVHSKYLWRIIGFIDLAVLSALVLYFFCGVLCAHC